MFIASLQHPASSTWAVLGWEVCALAEGTAARQHTNLKKKLDPTNFESAKPKPETHVEPFRKPGINVNPSLALVPWP